MEVNGSFLSMAIFSVCLFAAITTYLLFRVRTKEIFSKALIFTASCIFLHSLFLFVIGAVSPDDASRDRLAMAPFTLVYGPILYFLVILLKYNRLSRRKVLLHAMPLMVYGLFFILLLANVLPSSLNGWLIFEQHLTIAEPLSFVGYTALSLTTGRVTFVEKYGNDVVLFPVLGRLLLVFVAMIIIPANFTDTFTDSFEAVFMLRTIIYTCMFLSVLILFNYAVNKLTKGYTGNKKENSQLLNESIPPPEQARYERSALSEAQLSAYEQKLRLTMTKEKLYLQRELSLSNLAYQLKIPKHHLTQVFGMQIHQTFYQYVNGLRVDYACELLRTNEKLSMEELAEASGFNSKASFNRHFKEIKNCTPSAYMAFS